MSNQVVEYILFDENNEISSKAFYRAKYFNIFINDKRKYKWDFRFADNVSTSEKKEIVQSVLNKVNDQINERRERAEKRKLERQIESARKKALQEKKKLRKVDYILFNEFEEISKNAFYRAKYFNILLQGIRKYKYDLKFDDGLSASIKREIVENALEKVKDQEERKKERARKKRSEKKIEKELEKTISPDFGHEFKRRLFTTKNGLKLSHLEMNFNNKIEISDELKSFESLEKFLIESFIELNRKALRYNGVGHIIHRFLYEEVQRTGETVSRGLSATRYLSHERSLKAYNRNIPLTLEQFKQRYFNAKDAYYKQGYIKTIFLTGLELTETVKIPKDGY